MKLYVVADTTGYYLYDNPNEARRSALMGKPDELDSYYSTKSLYGWLFGLATPSAQVFLKSFDTTVYIKTDIGKVKEMNLEDFLNAFNKVFKENPSEALLNTLS